MGFVPHALSPVELQSIREAERRGEPFLAFRDGTGDLRCTTLGAAATLVLGRGPTCDVPLHWDPEVSRAHAQLARIGTAWTLVDDDLSRNGSYVNGERVVGRRRLQDGDVLRLGASVLVFRAPASGQATTIAAAASTALVRLTQAERRVLVALCRPIDDEQLVASVPATNRQIAEALQLSVDGVKTHVRSLFVKLGVGELPQYQKRTELARRAIVLGLVTRADRAR